MSDIYDEYREPPQGCGTAIAGGVAIIALIILLCFSSCKSQQPIVQTVEKERIVEIHTRDTAIITKADSASLQALLYCDSAYNVVVDELTTLQGERIKTSTKTQQTGKNVLLQVDCKEDSLRNVVQLKDKTIQELKSHVIVQEVKYVPNYYKNTSTGFWILLAVLVVIIGWKIAKIYFKIQSGGIL